MCGIVGWVNKKNIVNSELFTLMVESLHHRGPDANGMHFSSNNKAALGHTRLSFIDLTKDGDQPISNNQKNIWISFNGEIYNYVDLKNELNDLYSFKTNTDTEVIIAAYEIWGISFLDRLKGMFAIVILDERINQLFLIRDRFGIKPLYYYNDSEHLIFASELKSILLSGIPIKEIDFSSFADFFVYRYIPSPKTIWKNIQKIKPAHYIVYDTSSLQSKEIEYWSLISKTTIQEDAEMIQKVGDLIKLSVKSHSKADVPIGAFLSGGYDSSALVTFMKYWGLSPKTFSIGFDHWGESEHTYAQIVAQHHQLSNDYYIANQNSISLIDKMPLIYDEPIADISIIPTFLVSQLAAKKVKAVLSGEGADELFAGYTWQQEFKRNAMKPKWLNKFISLFMPSRTVDFYANSMGMGKFDYEELKKMICPHLHEYIPKDPDWFYRKHFIKSLSPLKSIQYLDIKCFMAELVLTKIDRASMANSLEVRVPFLDHDLFENIFSVEEDLMFKTNQTKYLLYENIKKELPLSILNRKKQGFVGPDEYYMQIDFYRKKFSNSKLVEYNIIQQSYIDELLNRKYDWKLWKILVMENWFDYWMSN